MQIQWHDRPVEEEDKPIEVKVDDKVVLNGYNPADNSVAIRLITDELDEEYGKFMRECNEEAERSPAAESPMFDTKVLVRYLTDQWFRGVVKDVDSKTVSVEVLDIGTRLTVNPKELKLLHNKEIFMKRSFTRKFHLKGLKDYADVMKLALAKGLLDDAVLNQTEFTVLEIAFNKFIELLHPDTFWLASKLRKIYNRFTGVDDIPEPSKSRVFAEKVIKSKSDVLETMCSGDSSKKETVDKELDVVSSKMVIKNEPLTSNKPTHIVKHQSESKTESLNISNFEEKIKRFSVDKADANALADFDILLDLESPPKKLVTDPISNPKPKQIELFGSTNIQTSYQSPFKSLPPVSTLTAADLPYHTYPPTQTQVKALLLSFGKSVGWKMNILPRIMNKQFCVLTKALEMEGKCLFMSTPPPSIDTLRFESLCIVRQNPDTEDLEYFRCKYLMNNTYEQLDTGDIMPNIPLADVRILPKTLLAPVLLMECFIRDEDETAMTEAVKSGSIKPFTVVVFDQVTRMHKNKYKTTLPVPDKKSS